MTGSQDTIELLVAEHSCQFPQCCRISSVSTEAGKMLHSLKPDYSLDLGMMIAHGDFQDQDLLHSSVQNGGGHHARRVSTLSCSVRVFMI